MTDTHEILKMEHVDKYEVIRVCPPTNRISLMANMSHLTSLTNDMTKEAKEAIRETGKVTSNASSDIQGDMAALRDDITKLTSQIANIVTTRGGAAWRSAKANVDGVVSDVQDKSKEAVGAVREVGDSAIDAIGASLKQRPYTTLAFAVGIGFLLGATWRR
jgi:ElaB/YqjD/DUF883 family membrane-anchored ribosome-binding protein